MSDTTPPNRVHTDDLDWLADQFEAARNEADLGREELVREAGYQNITKGLRRLDHIEAGDHPVPDSRVLERFAHVLDLDMSSIWETIRARERERRQEALQKPLEGHPTVTARLMPAVFVDVDFAEQLSTEEMLASATRFAERRGWKIWLSFDDGRTIHIEPDGTRTESWGEPAMYV